MVKNIARFLIFLQDQCPVVDNVFMGKQHINLVKLILVLNVCGLFFYGEAYGGKKNSKSAQTDKNSTPEKGSNSSTPNDPNSDKAKEDCSDSGGDQSDSSKCVKPNSQTKTEDKNPQKNIDSHSETDEANAELCKKTLNDIKDTCARDSQSAKGSCDDTQNSSMMKVSQMANVLGQQASASVQGNCSTMGEILVAAKGATAAFLLSCSNSIDSCSNSCSQALKYYNEHNGCWGGMPAPAADPWLVTINQSLSTCKVLTEKAAQGQQALQSFLGSLVQANNCSALANGVSNLSMNAMCAQNPSLPGCTGAASMDCSSPSMASNPVCICSKNPGDPSCTSGSSGGIISSDSGALGSSAANSKFSMPANIGDISGTPPIEPGTAKQKTADKEIDGKQGTGAMLGSDNKLASGTGSDNKAGTDPVNSNGIPAVTAGFYSGAGSSSSSGGGGGGSSGNSGNYNSALGQQPNLRQFLPGGAFDPKARGVAGVAGPDGMTGPNSNIWQKIQNRYNVVSPSLLP